ncbi:tetratricopeptide repeat protein [Acidovorax sp. PRC11]|uniref:tetratricopeptide repeat protein n=1 Tax=Acidovorax sp. PRC11 TaxID=2962592 RepID=UPI0028827B54|nr:tetratricopeptide repeat protein [Acidovorax sp. PRC11]MDT0137643.1 tetratricopeptide repeat protein [Acidovorax sp. PRC11]
MAKPSKSSYIFAIALIAAVLAIYLPGLHSQLLFDDLRLTEGLIFNDYGNILHFKQRMLSYGTFVWVDGLFGDGWWKQRAVNIALHLGVVAALYGLVRALLTHTRFPEEFETSPHFDASRRAALQIGVAVFALNPVAVYAVAYLIQRSILMATLFAVLACFFFVRGLQRERALGWYAAAVVSYVAAVLSKEHAVMVAAMAVPLYIHVRRPSWKTVAIIAGVSFALILLAAAVLFGIYGQFIGKAFDQRSIDFTRQLEQISPGIGQRMYPLSIINEAALFFAYGFLWFVPNVMWMSVDLRPAFPVSYATFPQILGVFGYGALLCAAIWSVLRRRGVLSLAGVALLFPLLLYVTEFATVWVQDPFVLYRSYLWAVAIPILVAIVLTGLRPRTIYCIGAAVGIVLGMLAFERVMSLSDDATAWGDAAEKIDMNAPANAVGRWRPFLNLGADQLNRGLVSDAQRNLAKADALGALNGAARFNLGVALQQQQKHAEALAAWTEAEKQGFKDLPLYYHRGESEFALGQFAAAYESFSKGMQRSAEGVTTDDVVRMREAMRLRRAEAAIGANRFDDALQDLAVLHQANGSSQRVLLGTGMAQVGKGDTQAALATFDRIIARTPNAAVAYYGRAMALRGAGRIDESLKAMDRAIALDPRNPQYPQVRAQIAGPAKKP